MMNLTTRQVLNNTAIAHRINGSKLGCVFQESEFAKGVETMLYAAGDGISQSIADGEGLLNALMEGVHSALDFYNAKNRQQVMRYDLEAVRPDLSGQMDPRRYDDALRLQRCGQPRAAIMERYGR